MANFLNAYGAVLRDSATPTKYYTAATKGQTLTGTAGADGFSTKLATPAMLVGGDGDDTYSLADGSATPVEKANGGVDTVVTWWRDYTIPTNIENLVINGVARVTGNSLDNIIRGDSYAQTIDGGSGNDVLIGGGGSDTFLITKGQGSDVIADFQSGASGDIVRLDGYALTSFAQVKGAMTQVGADVKLALNPSETLVFRNHAISDFTSENFQLPVATANRTLTFADDFNSLSLWNGKTGIWETTTAGSALNSSGSTLASNHEEEWYINSNYAPTASVKPWAVNNGILELTAEKSSAAIKPLINNFDYTSGLINSHESFSQTYGYFEMRAQLPAGKGLWPAFWLLPQDGSWPPELDIMEVIGSKPNTLTTTVHTIEGGTKGGTSIASTVADMTTGFHTYGVDWEKDTIRWYFDGVEVSSVATPADMHKPMYMVVNLAVGGTWPGSPDASTVLPAKMLIDYVHVYSEDGILVPTTQPANTSQVVVPAKSASGGALFGINAAGTAIYESAPKAHGLFATETNQKLVGGADADALRGNGTTSLSGGAGDDTYYVIGNDTVAEASGGGTDTVVVYKNYVLPANVENLTQLGVNVTATGNALDNIIQGGVGRQILDGGAGNDVLKGGAGSDIFVFSAGHDRVLDFQASTTGDQDILRVSKSDFANVEAVQAAAKLVDANHDSQVDDVLITHGSDTIELLNMSITKLDAGHLLFV